jgi:hypothetical protein
MDCFGRFKIKILEFFAIWSNSRHGKLQTFQLWSLSFFDKKNKWKNYLKQNSGGMGSDDFKL